MKKEKAARQKSDGYLMLEKYLLKNTRAKVGLFILLFFALVAVFAPLIAPY